MTQWRLNATTRLLLRKATSLAPFLRIAFTSLAAGPSAFKCVQYHCPLEIFVPSFGLKKKRTYSTAFSCMKSVENPRLYMPGLGLAWGDYVRNL